MLTLSAPDLGCHYSIDSEGTLFVTPKYENGTVDMEQWDEVDFDNCDADMIVEAEKYRDQLITAYKALGWYYQK